MSLLLNVIQQGGTVVPLLRQGLVYSQIADLLREAKDAGFVESREDAMIITESGATFLADFEQRQPTTNGGQWIRPADEYRIRQLRPDAIYLPQLLMGVGIIPKPEKIILNNSDTG